jgi:hypothetical protein
MIKLLHLLLACCFATAAFAKQPPPLDPTWGVYARLAGQSRLGQMESTMAGYTLSWRWERENEVLVEEWHHPRNFEKLVYIARITRGAAPGELLMSGNSMGNKQWAGQVASDGSVTWTGVKGMKLPFRVALLEDERMRVDYLDKSGGVKNSLVYQPPAKSSTEVLAGDPAKSQAQPELVAVSPPQPKPQAVPLPQPQPVPQPKPKPQPVLAPVARPADKPRSDAATIKARGIKDLVWRYCFTQAMGPKQFYWTDVFPADFFKRNESVEAFRVYLRAHGMAYLGVQCGDEPNGRAQAEAIRQREMAERAAKGFPAVETHWSEGE